MQGIIGLIQPLFQFIFDPSLIAKNPKAFLSYLCAAFLGVLILINPEWSFLAGYEWVLWLLLLISLPLIGRYTRNIITEEGQQVLIKQLQDNLKAGVTIPVTEFKASGSDIYNGIRKEQQDRDKKRAQ